MTRTLLRTTFLTLGMAVPLVQADALSPSVCQAPASQNEWHWYDSSVLAGDCQYGTGCNGLYIEPLRDWEGSDLPPEQAPLHASADRSQIRGNEIHLEGDVLITKGQLNLRAGEVRFNREQQSFTLQNGVSVHLPGLLLRGDSAELAEASGSGTLTRAKVLTFDTGIRASADTITRGDNQSLQMVNTRYTQCPPSQGSEAWSLNARKIDLDFESGRGGARDTTLRIRTIPVFYTPWLDFPIDDRRATGLLWPSFASSNGGLDISVPYYLNLAPNYDLTLIPRFLEKRGEMLESEARYLNSWSRWTLAGAYLNNDKQLDSDRWLSALSHQGAIGNYWSTDIDYSRVSDHDYFTDLSVAGLSVKRSNHLNEQARLTFNHPQWLSTLNLQQYQTIAEVDEPYRHRPQWALEYTPQHRSFHLEPLLKLNVTEFEHKDAIKDGGSYVTGLRNYAETGFSLPISGRAGYLRLTGKYRYLGYRLDEGVKEENPEALSSLGSLDGKLIFERQADHWTQTLEPHLYYVYADLSQDQSDQPLFDTNLLSFRYQQLFRESRFAGYDRLNDANRVSLGVQSRLIDQESGREFLSLGVGQTYYQTIPEVELPATSSSVFANASLLVSGLTLPGGLVTPLATTTTSANIFEDTGHASDIAAELRWQNSDKHFAQLDFVVDRHTAALNQAHLGWHYRVSSKTLYNFGYSRRREASEFTNSYNTLEQLDSSISYALNRQWQLFGRWQYDLDGERSLETLAGVAYEGCCWTVRALYQRALEPDDSKAPDELEHEEAILLEFRLKGLGGFGDKLSKVLEESIFGYHDD